MTPVQPRIDDDHPARGRQQPREPGPADDHRAEGRALRVAPHRATAPTSAARSMMGLEKLPPGVTLTADAMDPGLNIVPVVFEAKPDAAVGGFLDRHHRDPRRPEGEGAVRRRRSTRSSVSDIEQHAVHAALHRPHRDRGGRGRAVLDRGDRAEGAARAERLVQPAGGREARGGLQGARSRCSRCGRRRAWAFRVPR